MAIRLELGEMRGSDFPAHVMLAEPIRVTTGGSDGALSFRKKMRDHLLIIYSFLYFLLKL